MGHGIDDAARFAKPVGFTARAVALIVCFGVLCALFAGMISWPTAAYAETLLGSYPGQGATNVETSGTFYLEFDHNVTAGQVWGDAPDAYAYNSGLFYMTCEDGTTPSYGVYRNEGSSLEQKRRVYFSVSGLQPGTSYTIAVSAGMRSAGGHTYGGFSVTFTTAGQKPVPDPPTPPAETDPSIPPGGGGSGGEGGSDTTGGGSDQGGGGGTEQGGGSSVEAGAVESFSPETAVQPTDVETVATESSGDVVEESPASNGGRRAAGQGGGTVYLIGKAGLDSGKVADTMRVEPPVLSQQLVCAVILIAIGLAAAGAIKRAIVWHRHAALWRVNG